MSYEGKLLGVLTFIGLSVLVVGYIAFNIYVKLSAIAGS